MGFAGYDQWKTAGPREYTPEEERELEARQECERRGIDPDEECADGGVLAWMVVDKEMRERRPPPLVSMWDGWPEGKDPF